ncbi:MAG: hypothetical protein ACTIJK_16210 [Brachybacterium sp.]
MALLLTVLLMASLFNPSAAHAAPTVKEEEPNDTTATAQRVDLGTTVQGKIEDRGWSRTSTGSRHPNRASSRSISASAITWGLRAV